MEEESYIGYIGKIGNGWLNVKLDDGFIWPLPEFLKVEVTKSAERESFKILEGRFKGKTATVKRKEWSEEDPDGSYFQEGIKEGFPWGFGAEMTYYRKSKRLEIVGLGEYNTEIYPDSPTPLGLHDIEMPYEVHGIGSGYTQRATYAQTWFRLGHSGDHFLHCGSVSLGCITVSDIEKWDEIYAHLIISRKDESSVGTVNVVDE